MKRVVMFAAASLALVAGSAHAGGCTYGQHQHQASIASAEDAVEESVRDETDPKLLAVLEAQGAAELDTVVVPN